MFIDATNAPPVGMLSAGSSPPEIDFEVRPGEALLFFTDGLIERRDETLDAGFQRLADAVGQAPLTSASHLVAAAVAGCLDETERPDDACVLAILRDPKRITPEC
jgi:serine phosphatase RsbU (regulator of sigma subunit)